MYMEWSGKILLLKKKKAKETGGKTQRSGRAPAPC